MINSQKPIRIMIDFETTATGARAGILTLGACTFGGAFHTPRETFYQKASLASNSILHRTIDPATMNWWDHPDRAEARIEAFSGTQAVDDLLDRFKTWVIMHSGSNIYPTDLESVELWSRGAGFDCEIMQDAFMQIFGYYPFDFRKHMCQRTVERLMPPNLKLGSVHNIHLKHHALHDALGQADLMDIALRNMSWNGGVLL